MSPDRLVLAAGTLQGTPFLDRLAPARAAGFGAVSMFAADYEAMTVAGIAPAEIRARIADAGLVLSEVEIVGNWLPGVRRKPGMPRWLVALLDRSTPARVIDIAHALGAQGVTVGEMFDTDASPACAADAFAAVCDRAGALYVALEFIPTGSIATLGDAWEIVARADRANGGLLVDSWHFFRSGSDLAQLAALPAVAIRSVQLSDAPPAAEADLDHAMVHDRLLPGAGALDLAGFLAALRATGTQAPIAVEVFSDALAGEPAARVAQACADAARAVIGGGGDGG